MKILVIGYTESGKTSFAQYLAEFTGLKLINDSDIIITEYAKANNLDPQEVKKNKPQLRAELASFASSIQAENPTWPSCETTKLAGIVTGTRTRRQFEAVKQAKLYDKVIWVGRPGVTGKLNDELFPSDADIIIDNTGTLEDLKVLAERTAAILK